MSAAGRAVSNLKVYVGNLPWTVSKRELLNYLGKFGPVKDCKVLFNKNTGMSRGYGFAIFRNRDGVEATLSQNVHHLEGNRISVSNNRLQGIPKDVMKNDSENILS